MWRDSVTFFCDKGVWGRPPPYGFANAKSSMLYLSYQIKKKVIKKGVAMSRAAIHLEKFNRSAIKGLEIHELRKKPGISHSNPDIKWEKSKDNLIFKNPDEGSFMKKIQSRINELNLKRTPRKDAVLMCEVIISAEQTFFKKMTELKIKEFFRRSHDFLEARYGARNVVSSVVHLDETTPHLHFNFVPVTSDGRLSAKDVVSRAELVSLHTDFEREVGAIFDLKRGEKGGKRKHLTVAEFKEFAELTKAIESAKKELALLKGAVKFKESVLELIEKNDPMPDFWDDLEKLEVVKPSLFRKKRTFIVPEELFLQLKSFAFRSFELLKKQETLQKGDFRRFFEMKIPELESFFSDFDRMRKQKSALLSDFYELESELKSVNHDFKKLQNDMISVVSLMSESAQAEFRKALDSYFAKTQEESDAWAEEL